MDLGIQIKQLVERVAQLKNNISTEEATKNAFVMPFLQILGYDVFNPLEVVPEFICDIGIKKGEKIDYAIFQKGVPIILIECKHWGQNLNVHDGQLLRYFHVSKAKFGVLTNGIIYKFYTDLAEANKMDEKPFFEFNMLEVKDNQIDELKKFHKSVFNAESIVNTASELKYMNELKLLFHNEMQAPNPDFVKYFSKQVYQGVITAKVLDQFTALTKKSFQQYLNDSITERLKSALSKENESAKRDQEEEDKKLAIDEIKIFTTEEELEAYMIVKTILRRRVDASRITYRDAQSYFAILLDDNNRKSICRMYFGSQKKQIAIIDENKKEIKFEIAVLDDIFNYSDNLIATIDFLEK